MSTIQGLFAAVEREVQGRLEVEARTQGYVLPQGYMDRVSAKAEHIRVATVICEQGHPNMLSRRLSHNADVEHFADLLEAIAYTIITD